MRLELSPDHHKALEEPGHVLITGGPGSGKTTLALLKARRRIEAGLESGQSVLFLSFSKAATSRVLAGAKADLPERMMDRLTIKTFHSFFWEFLQTHGYLLRASRTLKLLPPHDEAALRPEHGGDSPGWHAERERLFLEEGLIGFDLFAPKLKSLLSGSNRLCDLLCNRYPLIIVDEAQDTGTDQWECLQRMAERVPIVCLADLDQQIYDYRPDVSDQRVVQIMSSLAPLRIDLQVQNHRSPGREIVAFGSDMLLDTPRGSSYLGVRICGYPPRAADRDRAIRSNIGRIRKEIANAKGAPADGVALLASWRRGVALIARALTGDGSQAAIPFQALIDEATVLLSGRFIAFLLEPKTSSQELVALAEALDLAASVLRAQDTKASLSQATRLKQQAERSRQGTFPRGNEVARRVLDVMHSIWSEPFCGNPSVDWINVRNLLKRSGCSALVTISDEAEQLVVLGKGRRLAESLARVWQTNGSYYQARRYYDAAVTAEQILSGTREWGGVSIMTLHQSKGKEFDGVIVLDDPRSCPLQARGEGPPFPRTRRLLRVGVTRARYQAVILHDVSARPPVLNGHQL